MLRGWPTMPVAIPPTERSALARIVTQLDINSEKLTYDSRPLKWQYRNIHSNVHNLSIFYSTPRR